ncbi:MAG: hypothetical protein AAGC55_07940, partial [Myxococcota bacterium]
MKWMSRSSLIYIAVVAFCSMASAHLFACAAPRDGGGDAISHRAMALTHHNGLTINGIGYNGFLANGLSPNGIGYNGIGYNGIGYNGIGYNGIG